MTGPRGGAADGAALSGTCVSGGASNSNEPPAASVRSGSCMGHCTRCQRGAADLSCVGRKSAIRLLLSDCYSLGARDSCRSFFRYPVPPPGGFRRGVCPAVAPGVCPSSQMTLWQSLRCSARGGTSAPPDPFVPRSPPLARPRSNWLTPLPDHHSASRSFFLVARSSALLLNGAKSP